MVEKNVVQKIKVQKFRFKTIFGPKKIGVQNTKKNVGPYYWYPFFKLQHTLNKFLIWNLLIFPKLQCLTNLGELLQTLIVSISSNNINTPTIRGKILGILNPLSSGGGGGRGDPQLFSAKVNCIVLCPCKVKATLQDILASLR